MVVTPGVPPPYTSTLDCALKTIKAEGPLALYKGWVRLCWATALNTNLSFLLLEFNTKYSPSFTISLASPTSNQLAICVTRMVAPLTGVTPMYSLCFLGYSFGQKIFCKEDSYKNLDLVRIGLAGHYLHPPWQPPLPRATAIPTTRDQIPHLWCGVCVLLIEIGATSGIFTTPVLAPLERVKCLVQIQVCSKLLLST